VTTAHNGCLHLEVTVRGRQGHAAMPESGVDALAAATTILTRIYDSRTALRERRSAVPGITHPTLNVGLIEGGINTNVVPDRVSFRIDRRTLLGRHDLTARYRRGPPAEPPRGRR
jgi:acetylornithine deacetylase/succinyl-diaminopimelate desuccinylase-like protein